MRPIGILGGTFDPVHYGHLRLAVEMVQRLQLHELRFIPLKIPPHRGTPHAGPEHRLHMLKLATMGTDCVRVDGRELERDGISYTIDTVRSLRMDIGDTPLCLVMGMDAFNSINTWHEWQGLLDYSHIIIADRPGTTLANLARDIRELVDVHGITEPALLHQSPSGTILHLPMPLLDISSTRIREQIAGKGNVRFLLPDTVLDYIDTFHLYQDCS